jgi:hypothetical protein
MLGQHTAKMFSSYVDALTPSEFTFKSLPDVKIEDYENTLDALPEPWVKDKLLHSRLRHPQARGEPHWA